MEMAEISGGGGCNMRSDLGKHSTHEKDAYQVFNGMRTSRFEDWRPPNRVLEVAIRKLVIQYALCQEAVVAVDVSDGGTAISSPAMILQGSTEANIAEEAGADLVLATAVRSTMDDTTGDMDVDVPTACSIKCQLSEISAPTFMNVPVTSPTLSPTSTLLGVPTLSVVTLSSTSLVHANLGAFQVFEEMLSASNSFSDCSIGLEMLLKSPYKYLLSVCSINSYEFLGACVPLDMHGGSTILLCPLLMKWVEQQPWLPPAEMDLARSDAELRPMPWTSFNCYQFGVPSGCAESVHTRACKWEWIFGVMELGPPWPPPAHVSIVGDKVELRITPWVVFFNCRSMGIQLKQSYAKPSHHLARQKHGEVLGGIIRIPSWAPPLLTRAGQMFDQFPRCSLMLIQVAKKWKHDGVSECLEGTR
ncbi:hypothetical protein BAE44_0005867 [Dichanthelium oligosanthes]|uniref:Uncharacterized protein n=1 Tax=Dichanthelium oligosanthes TaxID=888268 RepID=A0A1E5W6U2_9POAL|nr:hypothetical protein BAE44_0005867 [Dichanthelium oligosanthes]